MILSLSALLVLSAPTRADEPPKWPRVGVELTYARHLGAERCPSRDEVERLIRNECPNNPFDLDRAEVRVVVDVSVARHNGTYYADFTITRPDGEILWVERKEDTRCTRALDYVALAISVHTDIAFSPLTLAPGGPEPPRTLSPDAEARRTHALPARSDPRARARARAAYGQLRPDRDPYRVCARPIEASLRAGQGLRGRE